MKLRKNERLNVIFIKIESDIDVQILNFHRSPSLGLGEPLNYLIFGNYLSEKL